MDIIITIMQCCVAFACLGAGLWFGINFLKDLREYRSGR